MPINSSIFKAYDIRGLSPQELDAESAYNIGQALARFTNAKTIVVGRDMRETTPILFEAFARGANSQGANIIDIGLVTTPMFYWSVQHIGNADAGVMITASHNPSEYNGMKPCYGNVLPIGAATGMNDIRDLALAGPYEPVGQQGIITTKDTRTTYLDAITRKNNECALAPMNIVVDTGNGMEGCVIADLLARCPNITWYGLYLDLDGRFPNHEANPLKHETLKDLQHEVVTRKAQVGFAFDGDGDRVGVVDEQGNIITGDIMTALLAGELLKSNPGAIIIHDIVSSMVIPEYIRECGGKPLMSRVGHGFIKPMMHEQHALFAGELSNHFYFGDMANAESADRVMFMVMTMIARSGKPLSELVAPLKRYHHSGENNFTLASQDTKTANFTKIRDTYTAQASSISEIDGIRMEFFNPANPTQDWWFSVRASNTEPLIRLIVEARERGLMEAKLAELRALLG